MRYFLYFYPLKEYEHTNIVFGALGCGVFANPPEEVAEIFNEMIKKYGKCFDNIYFAIKSIRDNNYDVFVSKIEFNLI